MKRKVSAKKLLALFLSIMLFATAVPVALISAQNDSGAGFTDISLTLEESYEGAAYWVIELTSDKEIGFGNNSYWYRNLQQIADAAGEEHNALAQILRDNILINGKSIDAGLNESTDKATSTRIKVGCTDNSTQNKLYIAVIAEFVGQKDNVYGVNDYTEFTLEFKEGITLNSHSIKPVKYRYSPYDQTFKIDDGTRDFVEAKFETVDNYENDTYYLITLKSETNIGFGDNSYWYCNLQQISDEADEAHNELAQILRDNILINGKSVGSALNEAEDKETSTRIKIGCESEENESNLYIAVKCSDNQYAISANSDFKLEIKEGITLNGKKMSASAFIYYADLGKMVYRDPDTPDYVDDPNGATIQSVTMQMGNASCGDHLSGQSYFIRINTDKTLYDSGLNSASFYNRHLQCCAQDGINEMILSKIRINGKALKDCATDYWKAFHVKASAQMLEIEIPVDNDFGFNGYGDFTVEIDQGITLNNLVINPRIITYTANTGDGVFKIEKLIDDTVVIDPPQEITVPDYDGGATIKNVSVTKISSPSCSSHNTGAAWIIKLETDKDFGSNNSYWWRHLQADKGNYANGSDLLNNIQLNGKTLTACKGSADVFKFLHIRVGQGSKIIEIEIPANNTYGFNGDGDFTLEIGRGVTVNGISVNPRKITWDADATPKFKIEKIIEEVYNTIPDYDGGATIKNVSVTKISSPSCGSHNTGAAWVIKLETDKDFGSDNSYWWRHLQADKGNYANGSDLLNNIQLNGKTLTACKGSADVFKFLHIRVGQGSKTIEIEIPANNTYGFNGDGDFTLEIGRGVTVNGTSVNPRKITWDADATPKFKIEKIIEEVDNTLPDNSEYAIINNVSITKISAPSCASHNTGAAWVIKLDTDKDFGSDNSYWWRHLQANDSTFSDGADLRSKIKLNGKTLEECLGGGSDYTFLHIRVGQGSKTVEIEIPANNKYGFNGDGDFTLQILEGAKINNIGINPRNITYTAKIGTGTFKVEEFNAVDDDSANVATISNASIVNVSSPSCSSHNTGAAWVIKLETDKDFGSDNSYWWRHLQAASGDGKPANREDLLNNIKLNGNTLTQCMGESDVYGFLHIRVGAGSKTIEIEIPANNTYGFNGAEDFTLDILDGVTVNGFRLSPKTIKYTASDNQFTVEDYAPQLKYTTIAEAELTTESVTVGDESVEKFWLIKLKTGEDITVSGDLSKDLQFVERQRTQERKLLAKELINNITVNGETLAESMERAGTHYTARVSIVGNEIILKLNKKTSSTVDNDFHISNEEDFTVCLRENIIVSGVEIASARFRYDSALGKFVADDGEDVKNIAEAKLKITGAAVFENGKGITLWPSGTSRYVDVLLDGKVTEDSKNSEALANKHGEQSRNYIYVDGLSISEWIGYGEGDLYQVMVRFEGNIIRFLFDGSREPGMTDDEVHWIEFKDGLYSASGEKIMPCKLYYTPATGVWEIVDSFDGLEKPWTLTNFEKKTAEAVKGPETDPSYVLNWYDNDETVISQKLIEYEKALEEINNNSQNSAIEGATNTGDDNTEKIVDNEKVTVKKKYKTPVVYEDYVPVWAIVLIVAGVVLAAGAVCFIVIRKKRKANKI